MRICTNGAVLYGFRNRISLISNRIYKTIERIDDFMEKEIERKFLVNREKWEKIEKPAGCFLRQGYILTDPNKTIRVRCNNEKGFLAIKGLTIGATRSEFEYEIPIKDAKEILGLFAISEISKIRYNIVYKGKLWEVDEFDGENQGLIVAEIELSKEDEKFDLPKWVGNEVTGDARYYNSNLSVVPLKNQTEKEIE